MFKSEYIFNIDEFLPDNQKAINSSLTLIDKYIQEFATADESVLPMVNIQSFLVELIKAATKIKSPQVRLYMENILNNADSLNQQSRHTNSVYLLIVSELIKNFDEYQHISFTMEIQDYKSYNFLNLLSLLINKSFEYISNDLDKLKDIIDKEGYISLTFSYTCRANEIINMLINLWDYLSNNDKGNLINLILTFIELILLNNRLLADSDELNILKKLISFLFEYDHKNFMLFRAQLSDEFNNINYEELDINIRINNNIRKSVLYELLTYIAVISSDFLSIKELLQSLEKDTLVVQNFTTSLVIALTVKGFKNKQLDEKDKLSFFKECIDILNLWDESEQMKSGLNNITVILYEWYWELIDEKNDELLKYEKYLEEILLTTIIDYATTNLEGNILCGSDYEVIINFSQILLKHNKLLIKDLGFYTTEFVEKVLKKWGEFKTLQKLGMSSSIPKDEFENYIKLVVELAIAFKDFETIIRILTFYLEENIDEQDDLMKKISDLYFLLIQNSENLILYKEAVEKLEIALYQFPFEIKTNANEVKVTYLSTQSNLFLRNFESVINQIKIEIRKVNEGRVLDEVFAFNYLYKINFILCNLLEIMPIDHPLFSELSNIVYSYLEQLDNSSIAPNEEESVKLSSQNTNSLNEIGALGDFARIDFGGGIALTYLRKLGKTSTESNFIRAEKALKLLISKRNFNIINKVFPKQ